MTADEVPPPEEDTLFEDEQRENDQDLQVQHALEQARQYHAAMDAAKTWGRKTATDLRVSAVSVDDPEARDELAQAAALVETVTDRIEQGDNQRARQPEGR